MMRHYSLSSFDSIGERMVAEDQAEGVVLDPVQLITNEWVPRVAGAITTISSICMLCMAWKRRAWLFHRLVLGMSFNLLVAGVILIVGTAAIPSESPNALGNIGNVATCSTQGFLYHVCSLTAMFYYCSFSVYSFFGVTNNFDKTKYMWVEKYIHAIVPIYPISSAIYLASIQSFNNTGIGYCGVQSAPLGCNWVPNTPCERGAATTIDYQSVLYMAYMAPWVLITLCPTAIMAFLHYRVNRRHASVHIQAKTVAQQAAIYLAALYWAIVPFFIVLAIYMTPLSHIDKNVYAPKMFAMINLSLFGLWSMLSYRYFSVQKKAVSDTATATPTDATQNNNNNHETNLMPNTEENVEQKKKSARYIFSSQEFQIDNNNNSPTTTTPAATTTATTTPAEDRHQITERQRFSFNIFDGTCVSGAFAEFIHGGDSDDLRADNAETSHWHDVQGHI